MASPDDSNSTLAFVEGDNLSYHGYVVQKLYKKVKLDYPPEFKEPPEWVDVSYAVLRKDGKVLAKFDGVYFGMGNATRFGLFPLLGDHAKQLIVAQDVFRGGRQWVVSLSSSFRIIYDGSEYLTGREAEDMGIIDLDKDGVYEITQPLTAFYGFLNWALPTSRTPLPTIIFKYNVKAEKYLPANHLFQDYLLAETEKAKRKIRPPSDRIDHLAGILAIVLDYILAGQEQKAWAFYEERYRLPDKAEIKQEIKARLKEQPVYRFIYRKNHHNVAI
jgi:hypothetical protein